MQRLTKVFLVLALVAGVLIGSGCQGDAITEPPAPSSSNRVRAPGQWWPCGIWVDAWLEGDVFYVRLRNDPPCPAGSGYTWRGWD